MYLKDDLEKKCYLDIKILNKKVKFFSPNYNCYWRVSSILTREPETISWIDSFKNEKKIIFWDIGSNIGLFSIYACIKFNSIKVFSFEPSLSNLRVLSRNIYINNFADKINILPIGLGSKNKFKTFNESVFSEGSALHQFQKSSKSLNSYKTQIFSINFLIENNLVELPNYLKMDVDGIEDEILQGSSKLFENKNLTSCIIEINGDREKLNQINKFFNSYDFYTDFNIKKIKKNEFFSSNFIFSKKA